MMPGTTVSRPAAGVQPGTIASTNSPKDDDVASDRERARDGAISTRMHEWR
jgi:hypothetical protein